jgi:hypothetical protein
VLGILTLPAVKTLQPGALFGPALRPSPEALATVGVAVLVSLLATLLLWGDRIQWRAPREQQQEAETEA